MLRWLTFKCKVEKIVLVMSLTCYPVTQSIPCLIFLMSVRTIQRLNYGGQESTKQFAVNDSDTPVTLKQTRSSNLVWIASPPSKVIIMQSLKNLAWIVSVKKNNDKVLVKSRNTSVTSLEYVQTLNNSSIVMIYLMYLTILQSFHLIWWECNIFS